MAQRPDHPEPTSNALVAEPVSAAAGAGDTLDAYLQAQATDLLRALRLHGDSAGSAETAADAEDAVHRLRRAARRIRGALHTYRSLVDPEWADQLRDELSWLTYTLTREYAYASRLERLLAALRRLATGGAAGGAASGAPPAPRKGDDTAPGGGRAAPTGTGALPVGAARAVALLERRLTLARTRAHSAALEALGTSRFHAVADAVAVLASETPLASDADDRTVEQALIPLAVQAHRRLAEAVDALPLARAEHPYNAEALARSLTAEVPGDAAWHQVRLQLRLYRYAREVPRRARGTDAESDDARLVAASRALDRHRDAAEAAAAAAAAARTPRIAPATAYALGVLHADQRHEVEAARYTFGGQWGAWMARSVNVSERGL